MLRDALSEAQTTVRAYDTKAQIVGVGYLFAMNLVSGVDRLLPNMSGSPTWTILLAWGIVIMPREYQKFRV
jgi:hypothetical protein